MKLNWAALPAEGTAIFVMPSSRAIEIAAVIPRALKEPVGLRPSSFTQRSAAPTAAFARANATPAFAKTVGLNTFHPWSHGPNMLDRMAARGVQWPALTPAEMSDLAAYLNR